LHIDPNEQTPPIEGDTIMKTNTRFIKSVVAAAAKETTQMPWARGARRAAFIASRTASEPVRKTA
jgi:hypothetical protein